MAIAKISAHWLTIALIVAHLADSQVAASNCSEWSFDKISPLGPLNWPTLCSACAGLNQSPIDIAEVDIRVPTDVKMFESLQINTGVITSQTFFTLTNDGHTLTLKFPKGLITVTGGGLSGTYHAAFMHWHWGSNRATGSEHTVNGTKYAMEGHFVTYHSSYNSTYEAVMHPNGIAVFAIFYKDDFTTTNIYSAFLNNRTLSYLQEPGAFIPIPAFSVNYLLPFKLYPFYRYMGSLTYPPCKEGLIWTVFAHPVSLTTSQLQLLRTLRYEDGTAGAGDYMVNNYRPTQPLNGRPVYAVDPYSFIQQNKPGRGVGNLRGLIKQLLAYLP